MDRRFPAGPEPGYLRRLWGERRASPFGVADSDLGSAEHPAGEKVKLDGRFERLS